MVFKYVAAGLLAVGALGATYVAKTGGCFGPADAGTTPAAVSAEDCGSCPFSADDAASADATAEAAPIACLEGTPSDCAESAGDCAASAAECDEVAAECDAKPDCSQACESCEAPCDSPCDAEAKRATETTPSD